MENLPRGLGPTSKPDTEDGARFPWRIDHEGGMEYRLINLTNSRKYDVIVSGEPAGRRAGVFRMGGGRSNQFDESTGGNGWNWTCSLQRR